MSSSFVVPPQGGFANGEQAETAELDSPEKQNVKMHTAVASWDSYAAPTTSMTSAVNSQGVNGAQSLAADDPPKPLPKIGETRCCKSVSLC